MSSLSGAPPLGGSRATAARLDLDRPMTPDDEDDLFPPSQMEAAARAAMAKQPKVSSSSKEPKKKTKKDRKEKTKKKSGTDTDPPPGAKSQGDNVQREKGDDYSDDFFEEDHMPSVFGGQQPIPASLSITSADQAAHQAAASAAMQAQLRSLAEKEEALAKKQAELERAHEELMKKEKEESERKMREWNQQEELRRRQEREAATRVAVAEEPSPSPAKGTQAPPSAAPSRTASSAVPVPPGLDAKLLELLQTQLSAARQQQPSVADTGVHPVKDTPAAPPGASAAAEAKSDEEGAPLITKADERERRHRRERERAREQKRVHDEQAAHTLFQRLSNEVREIFRELNLYVVASERERLKKDEAYRREREERDRREEEARLEREARDRRDREEKEERFWRSLEERDMRFREVAEARLRDEELRREERWRAEEGGKLMRTKEEREMKEDFLRLERERREREDQLARERDRATLAAQLEEVKRQYRQQMDEIRQQAELDRQHLQELHKMELQAAEARHAETANLTEKHHKDQLALMDLHSANANKLEKLIALGKQELDEAQSMHERLAAERSAAMRERESQLADQQTLVKAMLNELQEIKGQMDKERLRILSLHSKFEVGIQGFLRENEEERRKYHEQYAHLETVKASVEKDRKAMLQEVHTERRLLEEQHNEFVERKMASMNELQAERAAITKERAEWQLARERQTRDETELLTSLRHKEEMLAARLEALERDRQTIAEKLREAAALHEESTRERELIRRQRSDFEIEKADILRRVEEVKQQAEETAEVQVRLRKELALERITGQQQHQDPHAVHAGRSPPHPSAYQMDLARQRAVLNRISSAAS